MNQIVFLSILKMADEYENITFEQRDLNSAIYDFCLVIKNRYKMGRDAYVDNINKCLKTISFESAIAGHYSQQITDTLVEMEKCGIISRERYSKTVPTLTGVVRLNILKEEAEILFNENCITKHKSHITRAATSIANSIKTKPIDNYFEKCYKIN